MDLIQATSRKRETYQVEFAYSSLWECALGIAAVTNTRLLHTLEQPLPYWQELKDALPSTLLKELDEVEANNTWKALLQLLHTYSATDLEDFLTKIAHISDQDFKYHCLPFVGESFQKLRKQAAAGEKKAVEQLQEHTIDNPFFPEYIAFISSVDATQLKKHLQAVMKGWYEHVVAPKHAEIKQFLERDIQAKIKMQAQLSTEELVQWATNGVQYQPEPSVFKVLLIPQLVYRPWTIEADLEGTKVFYYPIADESLHPHDRYMPPHLLIQKHKALGDEIRLRMVKLLAENDRTLQEITSRLDLGKSTVHHHLKLLRAAKLVEIHEMKYRLRIDELKTLHVELEQFLER
ncbi:ArsR/SmtB family transcription factor [Alkalihalobacillus pseudalcaliphilus]|uniref:ArsR/SmtB family transcription factor n=1 Tax=Alkalihalobacillus pseudalcaliphilus TaxID=79884 RepID=UPI00064D8383|nr:metalloregulator ArsR/SmtB family transcription factor [Alkalihalobacillus pseudalcaliphilus]KMK75795.1 ArsR family transcriptional regulator [Alkalihalobacillus pseudalcaliphilus]